MENEKEQVCRVCDKKGVVFLVSAKKNLPPYLVSNGKLLKRSNICKVCVKHCKDHCRTEWETVFVWTENVNSGSVYFLERKKKSLFTTNLLHFGERIWFGFSFLLIC